MVDRNVPEEADATRRQVPCAWTFSWLVLNNGTLGRAPVRRDCLDCLPNSANGRHFGSALEEGCLRVQGSKISICERRYQAYNLNARSNELRSLNRYA